MEICYRMFLIGDSRSLLAKAYSAQRSDDNFCCRVVIEDDAGLLVHSDEVFGFDAFQAITLVGEHLRCWFTEKYPLATWNGLPIDLAFPRAIPIGLGHAVYKEIELAVDRIVESKVDLLEASHKPE